MMNVRVFKDNWLIMTIEILPAFANELQLGLDQDANGWFIDLANLTFDLNCYFSEEQ